MGRKPKQQGLESEYHIVAVRLRVVGVGNLQLKLTDLSQVQSQSLIPIAMAESTRFEPTRLANFQSQRTRLEGSVSELDETFTISRILIYAAAVAVEYPM